MHDNYDDSEYNYPCCCHECGKEFHRFDLSWSYDCHGITFRLLCPKCLEHAMSKGYDGEYYDECDECLEYEY